MPITCDPDLKVEFSLLYDEKQPEEKRTVFEARFITCRQRRQVTDLMKQALDADDDSESERLILKALEIGLTGWRNIRDSIGQAIGFDVQRLPDILTDTEMWELLGLLLRQTQIAEADLKKSVSQSPTDSDESAKPADPADA